MTISNIRRVAAVGDSLTEGVGSSDGLTYPRMLGFLLGFDVQVNNRGVAGFTSTEAAISAGAVDVEIDPFTIPTGTGETVVTVTDPGDIQGPGIPTRIWNGVLNGVPGVLRCYTDTQTWTFARATAGSSTAPGGGTFHATGGDGLRNHMTLIWVGRNNYSAASHPTVLNDVAALVDNLAPDDPYALVIGVTTSSTETSGTTAHGDVTDLNDALADTYGDRFLDVRRFLIDDALPLLGIAPTSADTAAIAADTVPPTLLTGDGIHLTSLGYYVVARAVAARLTALGWTGSTQVAPRCRVYPSASVPTMTDDVAYTVPLNSLDFNSAPELFVPVADGVQVRHAGGYQAIWELPVACPSGGPLNVVLRVNGVKVREHGPSGTFARNLGTATLQLNPLDVVTLAAYTAGGNGFTLFGAADAGLTLVRLGD